MEMALHQKNEPKIESQIESQINPKLVSQSAL